MIKVFVSGKGGGESVKDPFDGGQCERLIRECFFSSINLLASSLLVLSVFFHLLTIVSLTFTESSQ